MSQSEIRTDVVEQAEQIIRSTDAFNVEAYANGDSEKITVDYQEIADWSIREDAELNEDLLEQPKRILEHFYRAIQHTHSILDEQQDIGLTDLSIRNLPDRRVVTPDELRTEFVGKYIGIRGEIARATPIQPNFKTIVFECVRCRTGTSIPQGGGYQEPRACDQCERKGPFTVDQQASEFEDQCRLQLKTPINEQQSAAPNEIDVVATGQACEQGGPGGLPARVGDEVVVYTTLSAKTDSDGNVDFLAELEDIEFIDDNTQVEIDGNREQIRKLSEQNDAVDLLKRSIAPKLHPTDEIDLALELAVGYLFGAPRISADGSPYRGDIHMLIIGDYGVGKSQFINGVKQFSPQCLKKSATEMTEVGLTAAAVQDDWGDGGYTIKPGVLVQGSPGHVILDEIDKGPKELTRINDAIEGEQKIDVEKGGISATYDTKVGLLATGNPENGSFDSYSNLMDEIDIDPSLFSRFDAILPIKDDPNEEQDTEVAEKLVRSFSESVQFERGDIEPDDLEEIERPVSPEIGRAWVQWGRELTPNFPQSFKDELSRWYAEHLRNQENQSGTPRDILKIIRFSMAHARLRLSETVEKKDVEWGMSVINRYKKMLDQTFDEPDKIELQGGSFTRKRRWELIRDKIEDGLNTVEALDDELQITDSQIEDDIEKMKRQGHIMEPETGTYKVV